jgi:enoyl-CoA hydratase
MMRRITGPQATAATVLFGEVLDGAEAERIGLVNRAVARDEVLPVSLELAREIAASAPLPVRGAKQALARSLDSRLDEQLAFEAEQQSHNYESADLQEGIAAARARRSPRFEGR